MPNESLQTVEEKALSRLTADELVAYEKYAKSGKAGLHADFQAKLYDLYLRGMTCESMCQLNPGLTLGLVVKARVDGKWDERRDNYTNDLLNETNTVLRKTAAESIQFLGLVLSVAHKEHGAALQRYLVTGDEKDLGDFRVTNFKHYASVIETIAKLIGSDNRKQITVVGGEKADDGTGIVGGMDTGVLTPEQADAVRLALEKAK